METVRQKMNKKISNMLASALNETYSYLSMKYDSRDLNVLTKILSDIVEIPDFVFSKTTKNPETYENLQEFLSTLNEKESIRKSKGVYYTPTDVVRFIIDNTIKSSYDKLLTTGLHVMDLNGIPYQSFCFDKRVLDPTCGAGEFILGMLETKFDLIDNRTTNVPESWVKKIISTIYGNDVNKESTSISKIRLFLCALHRYGISKCLNLAQILNINFSNKDFISTLPNFPCKFDLIIGNPPYVEDSKSGLKLSNEYGNIYANVLKNSSDILDTEGALGFVIPLSYVSTPRMKKIREELFLRIPEQFILSYADRPDCLFKSVHQKLCILIGNNKKANKCIYTGNYQYWYKEERNFIFDRIIAVKNNFVTEEYIPKLGTSTDVEIYKKISTTKDRASLIDLQSEGDNFVFINMRAAFWVKAFRQKHAGTEYKVFTFDSPELADYFSCLINSSLFWWYWICVSDCWHITNKELRGFFVPKSFNTKLAMELATALENKLESTKKYVGTKQTEFEYKHKLCLEEIHAIDDYINRQFGLTESESIYVKSFAFRYRIGGGAK